MNYLQVNMKLLSIRTAHKFYLWAYFLKENHFFYDICKQANTKKKDKGMIEQLNELIKTSMKEKKKERLQALRYIKSLLLENKTAKKPIIELDVVIKHHKKLKDSVELYPEGNPMREQILAEVEIVSEFLPKQLEEAEVIALIENIKAGLDQVNMGAIMKELSPQIKGKFNGKHANELVKKALA
ncbi:GatB/YqeY domain-containing protein [bacterium]|nr:GatB/YqeY domain-containing protein [bacterium]